MMTLHMLSEWPLVPRLGWTILHSLWEVLAVAAVLAVVLPALRRRGPRAAYAGCCLALALSLSLPVVTFCLLPSHPTNLDVSAGIMATAVDQPVIVQTETPLEFSSQSRMPADQESRTIIADAVSEQASAIPSKAAPFPVRTAEMVQQLNSQLTAWLPELVLAWAAGVCLLSVWNCGAWIAVQRLKSATAAVVTPPIEEAALRIARQLGLTKAVQLAQSTLIESPMVIGVWKPVILLPAAMIMELPPDQLEALLAHELAHVRRRDYLVNLLQTAIETLLFYHPGVWWISAQVRNEREHCCDDLAVRVTPNRAVYVQALAAVAGVRAPSMASAATGGQLLPRLQRLLGITHHESVHPARWLTGAMMLVLCGVFAVLSTLPARTATAETQPKTSDDSKTAADISLLSETGEFELRVVGPDGKPIPSASVEIRMSPKPTAEQILTGKFVKPANYGSLATTDTEGRLTVKLPQSQKHLDVNITTPGYGPYWAGWSSQSHAESIPAKFTAELEAGWAVSGIVVDDEGRPVEGVAVHPSIKFKKRPGDLHDLHVGTRLETDAAGQWQFDSVPASKDEVFVEISHPDFMPLRRALTRSEFGIELGQQPKHLVALDRGLTVTGKVADDAGNPIAGALIRTKFGNDLREAKSNDEGVYQLAGCEPRTARIVVSAKGKATDMQEVKVDAEMEPVDFQMKPGGKVHVQVLDQAGNPVPKARIFFQRWRGNHNHFEFDHVGQYADENGVWVWNEAPLDEFQADICPPNGMELGAQRLIARDEPHVFRTPPALVITGSVVDAETKQPIPKFRVVPGVRYESGRLGWMNREQFVAIDGKYQLRHTNHRDAFLVRIEADGYQAEVSRNIKSDEGAVTIDFELAKGVDVAATILTPAGAPAANAHVALGIPGSQISIKNGEFDGQTYCEQQKADEEGRFKFPPPGDGISTGDFASRWLCLCQSGAGGIAINDSPGGLGASGGHFFRGKESRPQRAD